MKNFGIKSYLIPNLFNGLNRAQEQIDFLDLWEEAELNYLIEKTSFPLKIIDLDVLKKLLGKFTQLKPSAAQLFNLYIHSQKIEIGNHLIEYIAKTTPEFFIQKQDGVVELDCNPSPTMLHYLASRPKINSIGIVLDELLRLQTSANKEQKEPQTKFFTGGILDKIINTPNTRHQTLMQLFCQNYSATTVFSKVLALLGNAALEKAIDITVNADIPDQEKKEYTSIKTSLLCMLLLRRKDASCDDAVRLILDRLNRDKISEIALRPQFSTNYSTLQLLTIEVDKYREAPAFALLERMNPLMVSTSLLGTCGNNKIFYKLLQIISPFVLTESTVTNCLRHGINLTREEKQKMIDGILTFIQHPKRTVQYHATEFISFAASHIIKNEITIDLDKWIELLNKAISIVNADKKFSVKLSDKLIFLLATASHKDYIKKDNLELAVNLKYSTLYKISSPDSFSADDNFLIGAAFTTGAERYNKKSKQRNIMDDSHALAFANLPNDSNQLFARGLQHLNAAADEKHQNATSLLNQHLHTLDSFIEEKQQAPQQREFLAKKIEMLNQFSKQLSAFDWAKFLVLLQNFASSIKSSQDDRRFLLISLARFKIDCEISASNPKTLLEGMLKTIELFIERLNSPQKLRQFDKHKNQSATKEVLGLKEGVKEILIAVKKLYPDGQELGTVHCKR